MIVMKKVRIAPRGEHVRLDIAILPAISSYSVGLCPRHRRAGSGVSERDGRFAPDFVGRTEPTVRSADLGAANVGV